METAETNKNAKLVTALIVIVVVAVLVLGVEILAPKKSNSTTSASSNSTPTPTTNSAPVVSPATTAQAYKDGSYNATGSYDSPGGTEAIALNVTLKDDKVTDTSAKSEANDSTAEQFQEDFIQAYKELVIGKDVNGIRLSHVSGSSLTSQGFNAALDKIKNQAKV